MSFYDQLKIIKKHLIVHSQDNALKIKQIISNDADLEYEFLKSISSLSWFNWLDLEGYFNPERIKFDKQGNACFWDILNYLEQVSEQVKEHNEYGQKLLKIIEDTVFYSKERIKKGETSINNYHIWWFFVKIINNLPSEIIKNNLSIDDLQEEGRTRYGFRTWLLAMTDPSWGSDLAVTDISEMLLPKFLADDLTVSYAETIIEVIIKIKPKHRESTYLIEDEAKLVWDSYWILQAFNKSHKMIGEKCSGDVIFNIANRLQDALLYKQQEYYVNFDIGDNVYQIKVLRIHDSTKMDEEIAFVENQYKCAVMQFSSDQLKNVDRENDFWALHNTKPDTLIKEFIVNADDKSLFISGMKDNLPGEINWENADQLDKKINDLYEGLYADYCHIWFKSLASGGREHSSGAEEVLTIILRDVLLDKCQANPAEGQKILKAFLTDQYRFPIFKRFVLLCIDKYWPGYRGLLNKFLEIIPEALEESDFEVELFDIFKNHNLDFGNELLERLKTLIYNVPQYYLEKDEKMVAYWKYRWLSAFKENEYFKDAYSEAKEKADPKNGKDYEPDRETIKGGLVRHKSPLSKEQLLQKPVPEIIKLLTDFKGADFWQRTFEGEPDKEGLAETLQSAVKEDTKKFTDELGLFDKIDYFYLHRILRGVRDAWNEGKDIDWEKILDFCLNYFSKDKNVILKDALKVQGEDSGDGKYIWIVGDIVDLIADGCRNDNRAFDLKYFEKADKIFDTIYPLLKGEQKPDTQRDAMTYALNTTLGGTVRAYLSFSLRVAGATGQKMEGWGKKKFEKFFKKGIDAFIWFGSYLPQMKYLDESYTKEKIEEFAQRPSDDFQWKMFMEGYLFGARLYPEIYSLMRENYLKAVDNPVLEERIDHRLVEHISFGYLYYGEALNEKNPDGTSSLFWKMLMGAGKLGKRDRWLEVASFFWSVTGRTTRKEDKESEEKLSEESKMKILEFWKWTFDNKNIVKDNLGEDYNSFLGRMVVLTIILDKIDEEKESWLLHSAPHIERQHNATFFIEYLTKFEDKESIKRIGKIYKKVLENTTPTFREEDIGLIVRRVYEKGDRNDAEAICNTYGRRGIHFLKPVWEEYHKKNN